MLALGVSVTSTLPFRHHRLFLFPASRAHGPGPPLGPVARNQLVPADGQPMDHPLVLKPLAYSLGPFFSGAEPLTGIPDVTSRSGAESLLLSLSDP
jgi:hypothetical protein